FPPGRGRLVTNPSPTGSATAANTIGIVRVSRWSAAVTGVVFARITSGCKPTNSFAYACIRLLQILAIGPTQFLQPLRKPGEAGLCPTIVPVPPNEPPDPPHEANLRLDPFQPIFAFGLMGQANYTLERYGEAVRLARECVSRLPNVQWPHLSLAS